MPTNIKNFVVKECFLYVGLEPYVLDQNWHIDYAIMINCSQGANGQNLEEKV